MGTLPVESAPTQWTSSAKRKLDSEGPTWLDHRQTKRRQIIPDSLLDGFSKLRVLSPRRLDDLPHEILLNIFQHFAEPWVLTDDLADWQVYASDQESKIRQKTLVALTQTCRRLNQPATSILYRCAHIPSSRSFIRFLSSLCTQPSLPELVKQVSCSRGFPITISRNPVPLDAEAFGSGSQQAGLSRPMGRGFQTSNPHNKSVANGHVLDSVLKRIPAIRSLSIRSTQPWTRVFPVSVLPLEHLSRLSISTDEPLGLYLGSHIAWQEPAVAWLNKSNLGRYPALKQLELVYPRGKWIASLVTVEAANGSGPPVMEKYVTSLTTCWQDNLRGGRWELLCLGQDIFAPQHLDTLEYGPQGQQRWGYFPDSWPVAGWDLNRFLATTGRRTRSLSLDWETTYTRQVQLGPTGTLTALPMLTDLTHLTVSMQVLFEDAVTFQDQLESILDDPEAELARLLPASLRVLRISEFILGVISPDNQFFEDYNVAVYNILLLCFIEVLRAYWLDARRGRELWFRHCVDLEYHPRLADVPSRCQLRWLVSSQRREDVGRRFARVYPMLPGNAARYRDEIAASNAG